MKTKYYFLAALAGMMIASCSSDDFIAEAPPANTETDVLSPIVFSSLKNNFTRADYQGSEAAELLDNKFVVAGFKGTATASPGSIVFDNYLVEYAENTANTTESNTKNWEYVGKGVIQHAKDHGITQQTIKYWDYTATQYDFLAWSTGSKTAIYSGDPGTNEVLVSAITPHTKNKDWITGDDPTRPAYTFTGTAANLSQCYISDLVTVNKSGDPGVGEVTGYDKTVTLKFRQLGTKVRIGIYETVPGYSVKNVKFYTKGGQLNATTAGTATTPGVVADGQIVEDATIFSEGADIYTEGTYTVYFPTVDTPTNADNNQAHIKFAPKEGVPQTKIVDWGGMDYTYKESGEKDNGPVYLGRTSMTATFADKDNAANNYYRVYLPNETGTNLNLRVDFTLESIDGSGEIIEVKNAKAQVPSIYTTWKPGYAYTYLFKISDNTNGRTGVYDPTQADDATINSDPAGLYPITFDALVVNAEDDKTQETITTIATPSITSYQQKSTVVNANEYTVNGKDIFVTVNDNASPGALITMNTNAATANGAALYILPSRDMTEAEVIDALAYRNTDDAAEGTILGRSGKALTIATNVAAKTDLAANKWMLTNSVEFGANGNAISVGANQALRFTPETEKTYAFVYTQTAADPSKDKVMYEAIKFRNVSSYTGKRYRYAYKATTATSNNGTPENAEDDIFDALKGHVYFTLEGGIYTKVANPFIGQGATNLFTRSGSAAPYTYTKVTTDYAQSGVKYYYTTDGQNYPEAHLVAYGASWATGLYEKCEVSATYPDGYKPATGDRPANGVAYYYKDGANYIYCVFLPQQVKGMWELDTEAAKVETEEAPVEGQTYFAKYNYDSAVRYAKVIKVQ